MLHAAETMSAQADAAAPGSKSSPARGLWGDPDRILQTLINLLSNAIKFSPAGEPVRLERAPTARVRFEVADRGRGIPSDQLEAVFERFRQVDASDSREKGGTGLGLPIARSIVHQHGGRIWAESEPGEGTTFAFTLPAIAAVTENDEIPPDGKLALVVEDDAGLARVLEEMLGAKGIERLERSGGYRRRPPDGPEAPRPPRPRSLPSRLRRRRPRALDARPPRPRRRRPRRLHAAGPLGRRPRVARARPERSLHQGPDRARGVRPPGVRAARGVAAAETVPVAGGAA